MVQNRNKLIELFIGNLSNSITHKILEIAAKKEEHSVKYNKELTTSFDIAKKYRETINPKMPPFPDEDINYIKSKIINRVKSELSLRIEKGYEGINLLLIEPLTDDFLKQVKIF